METGNRDKLTTIAAALVGTTSVDRPHDLDVESVRAALVSLTPADLAAARPLADHLGPGTFPAPAELGPDGLFCMGRLQAAGLLESVLRVRESVELPGCDAPAHVWFRFTPTYGHVLDLLRARGIEVS